MYINEPDAHLVGIKLLKYTLFNLNLSTDVTRGLIEGDLKVSCKQLRSRLWEMQSPSYSTPIAKYRQLHPPAILLIPGLEKIFM